LFLRDLRNITLGDLVLLWFHLGIAQAFLIIGLTPSPPKIPLFPQVLHQRGIGIEVSPALFSEFPEIPFA
jgi:hypothetical protein